MKTTGLQIFDWIEINHNRKKVKVKAVYKNMIDTTSVSPLMGDEVSPIPLTPEVLKANGFECFFETSSYVLQAKTASIILLWDYWFKCFWWNAAKIRYAHELQHALRLSGLVELADNFKVE